LYEPEDNDARPAPPAVLDVEVVGEQLEAPPRTRSPRTRPPPSGDLRLGDLTAAEFDRVIAEVALNPEHPAWGKVAPLVFTFFHGAEMIRMRREAEREQQLQPKLGESTSRAKLREILERARPVGP
jgi:hypothetical protein